ncbi:hypothetical protein [Streptomyces sp. NPDC060194]|uniref:hypothetical protein n=1 Tax=Streptomyces sp. NPDC060194 TaxID=3347069 RepID=UPI0036635089
MAARRSGSADSRCPTCRAPVIRQWTTGVAALQVTVDATPQPLTREQQATARGPNSLIWCLHQPQIGPPRIRWTGRWHPPDCPHPHVAQHRCKPAEPTTLF